ncbi:hypothetical protein CIB48_g7531 [Xylaria polymorpha]|nr:hypothetical protein CIB48_g7531 [Xylaria polymorpha]
MSDQRTDTPGDVVPSPEYQTVPYARLSSNRFAFALERLQSLIRHYNPKGNNNHAPAGEALATRPNRRLYFGECIKLDLTRGKRREAGQVSLQASLW